MAFSLFEQTYSLHVKSKGPKTKLKPVSDLEPKMWRALRSLHDKCSVKLVLRQFSLSSCFAFLRVLSFGRATVPFTTHEHKAMPNYNNGPKSVE